MNYKINELSLADKFIKLNYIDTRIIKIKKWKDKSTVYKDFVIDGSSVSRLIMSAEPNAPTETTLLRDDFVKPERIKYIKRLLGTYPTDLVSGRTTIYVCPIDGDNSCGVAACNIEFEDDLIVWRDFAWDGDDENDNSDNSDEEDNELEQIKGLTSYKFERKAYERLLEHELKLLEK